MPLSPLSDPNTSVDYKGLFTSENVNQGLAQHFADAAVLSPDEGLHKLLMLAVFAPYADDAAVDALDHSVQELKSKIDPIDRINMQTQHTAASILDGQVRYLKLVESGYSGNEFSWLALQLARPIKWWGDVSEISIAPIAQIVAFDYFGLVQNREANVQGVEYEVRMHHLQNADYALMQCAEVEQQYGNPDFPVWQGFALFNQARVQQSGSEKQWVAIIEQAIAAREKCAASTILLPDDVREGLVGEVHYARLYLAANKPDYEHVERYCEEYDAWSAQQPQGVAIAADGLRQKIIVSEKPATGVRVHLQPKPN